MRRVILLVCLLGCGSGDGSGSATTGGAGGAAAGGSASDGGVATGGATGGGGAATGGAPVMGGTGGAGAAGMGGTGGTLGTGGSGTGDAGSAPDSGPADPLTCPQAQNFQATLCGFAGPQLVTWVGRWKAGHECSVCTSAAGQHVGCTVDKGSRTTEGPGPMLCVATCGECCYRQPDVPCSNDADCCAPMHCQAGDAGGKSCR